MSEKIDIASAIRELSAPILLSVVVYFLMQWNAYIKETFKVKGQRIKELEDESEQAKIEVARLRSDLDSLHDDIAILREVLKGQIETDNEVERKLTDLTNYIKDKLEP